MNAALSVFLGENLPTCPANSSRSSLPYRALHPNEFRANMSQRAKPASPMSRNRRPPTDNKRSILMDNPPHVGAFGLFVPLLEPPDQVWQRWRGTEKHRKRGDNQSPGVVGWYRQSNIDVRTVAGAPETNSGCPFPFIAAGAIGIHITATGDLAEKRDIAVV